MEQVIKNCVVLLTLNTEIPQFSMKQSEIEIKIKYLTRTQYIFLIFEIIFLRAETIVYKLIAISQNNSISIKSVKTASSTIPISRQCCNKFMHSRKK